MAPHLLSFSARARQEQEALKVALANGDGASLKSISERLVHRQGPGALQLLMRKLASNAEALAFWQQQLLPVQQIAAECYEEVKEVVESCPPEPIVEKKSKLPGDCEAGCPAGTAPCARPVDCHGSPICS